MSKDNICIELVGFPDGIPQESNFRSVVRQIETPNDGEFLVRNLYLSLDPFLRGVISGLKIYGADIKPGDVMLGTTVSVVIESNNKDYQVGDYVLFRGGWQEYAVSNGEGVQIIDPKMGQLSVNTGILGMPGLTAYAGLLHTAEPVAGDTVVVSAAAGPVGSLVGQLARIHGCRVVGIAGSDEKCSEVVTRFGFDACINYKTEELSTALDKHCSDGINVYFDNVGGTTLEAVVEHLALGARITLCGLISQYNSDQKPAGPNLGPVIGARAIMKGFVVYDHYNKWDEFRTAVSGWINSGEIHFLEDRAEGLTNAPAHFCRLMRGENVGKSLVVIGPE